MITGAGMRVKLPYAPRGEMFATVTDISGGSRMKAFCEDDKHRMVRIPGKFKKKMWCRVNDIIIIKKWAVQSDEKSDLVYRYRPNEREVLKRKGLVPKKMVV
jgi:translation initiation factor 1A